MSYLQNTLDTVHLQASAVNREAVQRGGQLAGTCLAHLRAEAVDRVHFVCVVGFQHAAHGVDRLLIGVQHATGAAVHAQEQL